MSNQYWEQQVKWIIKNVRNNNVLPIYKKYLYIQTDKRDLILFKPNKLQLQLEEIIQNDIKKKGYVRIIILKARRHGISTHIEARLFLKTAYTPYYNTAIVAHNHDANKVILDMSKLFYQKLPTPIKPKIDKDNMKELSFSEILSTFYVFTASGKNTSRSTAFSALHATEAAFYPNDESLDAILQTIKDIEGTEIYFESTANTASGYFFELYKNAKLGNNDYTPVFFPWFIHPEYKRNFISPQEKETFMNNLLSHKEDGIYGDEELEMKTYNLTPEQMNWRRYMIDNKCARRLQVFKREYPANDEECFMSSGAPVFNLTLCKYNMMKQTKTPQTGYFKESEKGNIIFVPSPSQTLIKVYHPSLPIYEHKFRYCAGVDASDNVEGGDKSALYVLDRLYDPVRVVCSVCGYIDPDILGEIILKINEYYKKDVYFCIERSPAGNVTINTVYKKLSAQLYNTRKMDSKTQTVSKEKVGFETNKYSKKIIINNLDSAIRNGKLECADKEFWEETFTFMYVQSKRTDYMKMQAMNKGKTTQNRYFDDRVLAMALALEMHRTMPPVIRVQTTVKGSYAHLVKKQREQSENINWWVT